MEPQVTVKTIGYVTKVEMPLVTVTGLPKVKSNEIVTFESGTIGQVLSFANQATQIMVLDSNPITIGSKVTVTGNQLTIPLYKELVGSVLTPLGLVIQGKKPSSSTKIERRNIDTPPLPLSDRALISEQLVTGVTYVDSLLPLAKGQRQLITGDRQTEKTPFLYQVLLSQAQAGSLVIFSLIGKRHQDIVELLSFVDQHNLRNSVVVVASTSLDSPSTIALTPFTAMTVAEYYRDLGRDTVVIFDDLTTHAKFVREVALIANSFPGRDSYPGHIFYTHARLLERAGSFQVGDQTHTITALPVAQTQNNELTDFIVSNLISITDGHLLFDTVLRQRGQHPPINTALSVTRVGKQTQSPVGRQLSRDVSIFLNRYNEVESLVHFGSELAAEAQQILVRGKKLEAFFNQNNLLNMPLTVQYIGISLILKGQLDQVDITQIVTFKQNILKAYANDPQFQKTTDAMTQLPNFAAFTKEISSNVALKKLL